MPKRCRQFWIRDECWFEDSSEAGALLRYSRSIWTEGEYSATRLVTDPNTQAFCESIRWYPNMEPFSPMRLLKVKRRF